MMSVCNMATLERLLRIDARQRRRLLRARVRARRQRPSRTLLVHHVPRLALSYLVGVVVEVATSVDRGGHLESSLVRLVF